MLMSSILIWLYVRHFLAQWLTLFVLEVKSNPGNEVRIFKAY